MNNTTANPYRISLTEMLKQEGRTFEAMAEEVMFGDANALALCTEHCEVEPDGTCPLRVPGPSRALAPLNRDLSVERAYCRRKAEVCWELQVAVKPAIRI